MYIHIYRTSGITIIPKFSGLKQNIFILTHVPGVKWNLTDLDKGTCTKCMVLAPTFRLDPHLLHPRPNRPPLTCAPHGNSRHARGLNRNTACPLRPRLGVGIPALLPAFSCLNQVIFPSPSSMGKENEMVHSEELLESHTAKNEETVEE